MSLTEECVRIENYSKPKTPVQFHIPEIGTYWQRQWEYNKNGRGDMNPNCYTWSETVNETRPPSFPFH